MFQQGNNCIRFIQGRSVIKKRLIVRPIDHHHDLVGLGILVNGGEDALLYRLDQLEAFLDQIAFGTENFLLILLDILLALDDLFLPRITVDLGQIALLSW